MAALCASDVAALVFIVWVWISVGRADPAATSRLARTEDASPVAADGKIYASSEDGDVFVIKAGPEYQELAKNTVGEILMATPAISDGLIIFRGHKHVIAVKAQ